MANFWAVLRFLPLLVLSTCGPTNPAKESERVRIIVRSPDGSFRPQIVKLETITNWHRAEGTIARILPSAVQTNGDTTLALNPGPPAQLSYRVRDRVVIPLTQDAMEMLTIYANFENIYVVLRDQFRYPVDRWGVTRIYFGAEDYQADDERLAMITHNNGVYDWRTDSIFLYRTTDPMLPYAMSINVLAHEMGHRLVNWTMYERQVERHRNLKEFHPRFAITFDEGLADYFVWLLAGGDNPMYGLNTSDDRALPASYTYSHFPQLRPGPFGSFNLGEAYQRGSVLASALREVSIEHGRIETGRMVINALESFGATLDEPQVWEVGMHSFLAFLIDQFSGWQRRRTCDILTQWFDDEFNYPKIYSKCAR